jgi:hypothetical protein
MSITWEPVTAALPEWSGSRLERRQAAAIGGLVVMLQTLFPAHILVECPWAFDA